MIKKIVCIISLVVCIFALVTISGCTTTLPGTTMNKTVGSVPDPKTGIVEWVNDMNNRDLNALYLLAPDEIRHQISYSLFIQANQNNELFTPGWEFTNFTIVNETINNSTVTAKTLLILKIPPSANSTQGETIPLYDTFNLTYEDNQWKVWDM